MSLSTSVPIFRRNKHGAKGKRLFKRMFTYQSVSNGYQFIADNETTVHLGGPAVHDFGHVDPIVTRYMLIADTTSDAEAKTLVTLDQLDLHQLCMFPSAYILKIDSCEHDVN